MTSDFAERLRDLCNRSCYPEHDPNKGGSVPDHIEMEGALLEAAEEIERLSAIVDRLPKTADGVPIVCEQNLYVVSEDRRPVVFGAGFISFVSPAGTDDGEWLGTVRDDEGGEWEVSPSECYSTRADALEAQATDGREVDAE